ncbi:MAG TPA: Hsp20/alpha crystallin family protein [Chloroflexota bacterium]|nr:Hsp20/alpha crystallin family protein [Chloroflexota bacterium]
MRYRRLTARYVSLVSMGEVPSLGDLLRTAQPRVMVAPTRWRPAADVCESATALAITVELAGVDEDDLEVTLFEDALVVEGVRRPVGCMADGVYHSAEIRHGPFRLEVPLPVAVDTEAPQGRYERGLLHISLPKAGGGQH